MNNLATTFHHGLCSRYLLGGCDPTPVTVLLRRLLLRQQQQQQQQQQPSVFLAATPQKGLNAKVAASAQVAAGEKGKKPTR